MLMLNVISLKLMVLDILKTPLKQTSQTTSILTNIEILNFFIKNIMVDHYYIRL